MENFSQMYAVYLPDFAPAPNGDDDVAYLGTEQDIFHFVNRLERSSNASDYQELIDTIRCYGAEKCANSQSAKIPFRAMKEYGRKEYTLEDHKWIYTSPVTGCEYLMRADLVWVSYVVVQEAWNIARYEKAMFENLEISVPGVGWVRNVKNGGTPGVSYVEHNPKDDSYITHMTLYRRAKVYQEARRPSYALADFPSLSGIRLNTALEEIVGHL